jgi:hypothetical protein
MSSANGLDQSDTGATSSFAAQKAIYERVCWYFLVCEVLEWDLYPIEIIMPLESMPRTSCQLGDVRWITWSPQKLKRSISAL